MDAPTSAIAAAVPRQFGTLNYTVLAVYFVAMLIIGIWAGRKNKGSAGYFLGEGKVHHVLVGISLLGTYLSSLTMMALPRVAYGKDDWLWTIQLPFLIITALVITGYVLPRYREAGCLSVYEYLERRIHVSVRIIASLAFIALSIGRMGLVLYLPALAFHVVTSPLGDATAAASGSRVDLALTIVVMGVVTAVYTVLGGIKGIIWTDVIQVVIFVLGAVISVFYMLPGDTDFFAVANASHKFRALDLSLDVTKLVSVWLVLETLFQTVRIYATQQEMTQRYMTTDSTHKANVSVWISILGYIPLGYLFYFIGTGLFVFYQTHPDAGVAYLEKTRQLDSLYAYFAVSQMPAGLAGLVIAAFYAAAMSTISSSMNSCSAVCVEDFYKRFWMEGQTDEHYVRVAKALAWVWGAAAVGAALLCMQIEAAQVVWSKIMSVSTCGILGLMVLAFMPWRIDYRAAIAGFISAYLTLVTLMFCLQITPTVALVDLSAKDLPPGTAGVNFLLWPVLTNLVCIGVALLVNVFCGARGTPAASETQDAKLTREASRT